MKLIKRFLSGWDIGRLLKLVLGVVFGLGYVFDGQAFYLLFAVFFLVQAALNIGCGCATGGCNTESAKKDKTVSYQFDDLNLKGKKDV